jgi:D-alanyl-lipoteichoic acid acyltransferase DltB (MBOAT superfamily)
MLERSFGAGTFAGFWRHWNPVFGYYLGRYIDSPLRRVVPRSVALILTFVFCGVLHDLVTTTIRGSVSLFFTPWFLFFGLGVILGRLAGWNFSSRPWVARATINALYVFVCLALTLLARRAFDIP